jgi:hypothetical protein
LSRIADLGKKYEKLPAIIAEYDAHLDEAQSRIAIKGKIIEEALKEQAAWPVFYDEKRRELNTLVKFLDAKVSYVRGKLTRDYTERYSRELSDRVKDKYIDNEDEYMSIYEVYLEVLELAEKYDAVVDAFKVRGFALRDITQLRIAQMNQGSL